MLNPKFLEAMNGVLFMMCLYVVIVFGVYLWTHRREGYSLPIRAAIAISCFFLGETIIRGWVWWWRHQVNDQIDVAWMNDYPVLFAGVAVSMFGAICVARIFSPSKGHGWIIAAVFAVAVAGWLAV